MTAAGAGHLVRLARLARGILTSLLALGFLAWVVFLRPTALGGSTTYVVVAGDSMLPVYRPGDLILAQPAGAPAVGTVAVYRIPAGEHGAGRLIIHRIVAADTGTGYTTRGDHNSYTDPWHPRPSDVVGAPAFVLPGVGTAVGVARTPIVAGLLAGFATMAWLWLGRRRTKVDDGDSSAGDDVRVARPNPA